MLGGIKQLLIEWTQCIRDLCQPFTSTVDFTAALDNMRLKKTNIPEMDEVMAKVWDSLVFQNQYATIPGVNLWLLPAPYFRSGRINLALQLCGTTDRVSTATENRMRTYLQYITPEYFEDQFDSDILLVNSKYPDLNFIPTSGDDLKSKIKPETQKMIELAEKRISLRYPKQNIVGGMFGCLSMDRTVSIYDRLVTMMQQRVGCYTLTNTNGKISSCKIRSRTCDPNENNSCLCSQGKSDGTSNPFVFMRYLVRYSNNGDAVALALLADLNTKLTTKLVDETTIETLISEYDQLKIVWDFQQSTYGKFSIEPYNPCEMADYVTGTAACESAFPIYNKNAANNLLDTEKRICEMGVKPIAATLLDLEYGVGIDFLDINPNVPIDPDTISPEPNDNASMAWWVVIVIVVVIIVIAIIAVFLIQMQKNKNHKY